jgi:hypothetical protein
MKTQKKIAVVFALVIFFALLYALLLLYYQDPRVPSGSSMESKATLIFIKKMEVSCKSDGVIIDAWSELKSYFTKKDFFRVCIRSNRPISYLLVNGAEEFFMKHVALDGEYFISFYIKYSVAISSIEVFFEGN